MQPKVSVIIPVYNVEKYLSKAIESVINQTLKDIEIILINDGSTDSSKSIIKNYEAIDNRIKVIDQKNQGLSLARNKGIELANSKYIYFMDSDDFIDKSTLEICYLLCETKGLDMVYFNANCFSEDKNILFNPEYYKKNMILEENLNYDGSNFLKICIENNKYTSPVWLYFFNKKLLNNLLFYPKIYHEDELFTVLLINQVKKMQYLNKNFYNRRYHNNSITTKEASLKHIEGRYIVIKELEKIKEKGVKQENINNRIEIQVNAIMDICIENNLRDNIYYKDILKNYNFLIKNKFLLRANYINTYNFYKFLKKILKKIIKRK